MIKPKELAENRRKEKKTNTIPSTFMYTKSLINTSPKSTPKDMASDKGLSGGCRHWKIKGRCSTEHSSLPVFSGRERAEGPYITCLSFSGDSLSEEEQKGQQFYLHYHKPHSPPSCPPSARAYPYLPVVLVFVGICLRSNYDTSILLVTHSITTPQSETPICSTTKLPHQGLLYLWLRRSPHHPIPSHPFLSHPTFTFHPALSGIVIITPSQDLN